ncbi:MAG: metallophosphoesterase [Chlamydiia bacterium]|nr:metallophosphoesterase [Chlamydiia bacterium]
MNKALKILLISDTHGNLDPLCALATKNHVDLIIHAGDFGFYSPESFDNLSIKELRLRLIHSPYRDLMRKEMKREELIELIQTHRLLGDFPDYLTGEKMFPVPLYTVWGNHEDDKVVEHLRQGHAIQNLHLLDETQDFLIKNTFHLYGLGGNFLINDKTFAGTFQGAGGKIQATFHQLGALIERIEQTGHPSIFVSHVSPGKEPLLTRLFSHLAPNFWISGHMGAPFPCVWNQQTIHRWVDIEAWLSDLSSIETSLPLSPQAKRVIDLLKAPLKNHHDWVRKTWNINLPDAHNGHALLYYDKETFTLETVGTLKYGS